jgi:hypothetical protein
LGPLVVGWILDLSGGKTPASWAFAYLMVAAITVMAAGCVLPHAAAGLAGDRGNRLHRIVIKLSWCRHLPLLALDRSKRDW